MEASCFPEQDRHPHPVHAVMALSSRQCEQRKGPVEVRPLAAAAAAAASAAAAAAMADGLRALGDALGPGGGVGGGEGLPSPLPSSWPCSCICSCTCTLPSLSPSATLFLLLLLMLLLLVVVLFTSAEEGGGGGGVGGGSAVAGADRFAFDLSALERLFIADSWVFYTLMGMLAYGKYGKPPNLSARHDIYVLWNV